jgi:hypothetical protein
VAYTTPSGDDLEEGQGLGSYATATSITEATAHQQDYKGNKQEQPQKRADTNAAGYRRYHQHDQEQLYESHHNLPDVYEYLPLLYPLAASRNRSATTATRKRWRSIATDGE